MISILKKELRSTLTSPLSYIVLAILIFLINFLFLKWFFLWKILSLRAYFDLLIWFLVIFIPAIWMKIISDEFKSWTMEFLVTKPISNISLITWKFLSLIVYFLIFILSTFVLYMSISWLGDIDWWVFFAQIVWLLLISIAMFGVSFFSSSITTNQVFAFLIAVFLNFLLVLIGLDFIQMSLPYSIADIFAQLSIPYHFQNFLSGTIHLSDVFYFLSIAWVSLYLSYLSLQRYQRFLKVWLSIFKWLEILLILWIFAFVNLIIWNLNMYADMTENKIHTVSEASKDILSATDELIDINFYVSAELPPQLKI